MNAANPWSNRRCARCGKRLPDTLAYPATALNEGASLLWYCDRHFEEDAALSERLKEAKRKARERVD